MDGRRNRRRAPSNSVHVYSPARWQRLREFAAARLRHRRQAHQIQQLLVDQAEANRPIHVPNASGDDGDLQPEGPQPQGVVEEGQAAHQAEGQQQQANGENEGGVVVVQRNTPNSPGGDPDRQIQQ
ncbi:uncharacterized protein LOC124171463 [Ischnura elegans]|uniref:uncharacterized protein LOC124171463 n=1 Tax=Ischnura elegans TaxID=197161 RepID=UPI001ED86ACF|nr:uncharacterized protein LOC124171463 [Ischnura elegans]